MPAFQSFSPLAGPQPFIGSGLNLQQQFTGAHTQIDGLPAFSTTENVGGSAGEISGGGLSGQTIVTAFAKAAKFGLQAFSFANTLSSISDFKKGAIANFNRMRTVVRERAEFDTERTEIAAFRLLKRQTAQASAGGFAGGSASTLSIQNRTEVEKDRRVTQINKELDDALAEIQKQESEARIKARGLKTKAITGFATSILSNFG